MMLSHVGVLRLIFFINLWKNSLDLLLKHLCQLLFHVVVKTVFLCKLLGNIFGFIVLKDHNSLGSAISKVDINVQHGFSVVFFGLSRRSLFFCGIVRLNYHFLLLLSHNFLLLCDLFWCLNDFFSLLRWCLLRRSCVLRWSNFLLWWCWFRLDINNFLLSGLFFLSCFRGYFLCRFLRRSFFRFLLLSWLRFSFLYWLT